MQEKTITVSKTIRFFLFFLLFVLWYPLAFPVPVFYKMCARFMPDLVELTSNALKQDKTTFIRDLQGKSRF